ncbi:MAG: exonuclease SbcCD subunit D [Gammaproteobacteria bacterium]|nr:exonuclease SbcCD subunit D [Gammaproteobacteria bacterium]
MKLLHTSDWHLGARLGRHDRGTDHDVALRGLFDLAEAERPDLILHTGDLFDASQPPYLALDRGIRALRRLAAVAPTIVLCGNHDSAPLFRVIDRLAADVTPRRLWFLTSPQTVCFAEIRSDPVAVACVPFIKPSAINDYASDDPSQFEGNYADGVRMVNDRLLTDAESQVGKKGIVLYAAHLHVHGARPGKSERRVTVGEDYATHVEGLQRAVYCAFGHIHDSQALPGGTAPGRYAGSLIPIDFGEAEQTKQATLVTIDRDVQVESRTLPSGRPLTPFVGTLEEFEERAAAGGFDGCILKARVGSEDPIPDLAERLLEASPACTVFEIVNAVENQHIKPVQSSEDGGTEPTLEQLFAEWLSTARHAAPYETVTALFGEALGGLGQESVPEFGLTELLSRADRTLRTLEQSQAE